MRTEIVQCDRCKQTVKEVITIKIVNTNVEEDKQPEMEIDRHLRIFNEARVIHPTISRDICYDCTEILLRWLGHQENELDAVDKSGDSGVGS